jgi:selenide,water dikinase
MGGRPVLALNIVCFPKCLHLDVLKDILLGGADRVKEAGALLVGGHTVQDDEPKYGLSVMGLIHPDRVVTNSGARPGDVLVLTKPLGTGIINTAIKADMADTDVYNSAVETMIALNSDAARAMQQAGAKGCTDITGFGLVGHCMEMAEASGVSISLRKDKIPVLEGARELARMGMVPAGAYTNKSYAGGRVNLKGVETDLEDIIFDPQTSGGLLISLPEDKAELLLDLLSPETARGCAVIGEVMEREAFAVEVL